MQITIDLPDSVALTEVDIRLELAIVLFQREQITLGLGSQFTQLSQIEFQRVLASRGIPVHYGVEDLDQDLQGLAAEGW